MAQRSLAAPMPTLCFARVETLLGSMWVGQTDIGVAAVSRDDIFVNLRRCFPGAEFEPADLDGSWIDRALEGGELPSVDLRGLSSFDARVYEAVRAVPPGETVTYGEVAAIVGSPGAARAVGGAMARCSLFPAVPCHRVVRASDGWSGWGDEPAVKRRLLLAEHRRRVTRLR